MTHFIFPANANGCRERESPARIDVDTEEPDNTLCALTRGTTSLGDEEGSLEEEFFLS